MPGSKQPKRIWIDLDNSPHVPFFVPIIEELEKRGYPTFLTARNTSQVLELADLHHLSYRQIGRHYGKNKFMKVMGTCYRTLPLIRAALKEDLALAVSHGSRSQLIAAALLRIPSLTIFDYEFARGFNVISPTWRMIPEVVFSEADAAYTKRAFTYPGLKEDAYIPRFRPNPSARSRLGVAEQDLMITIRPPASEAHYHNPKSDDLFRAVIDFLGRKEQVRAVVLPRYASQAAFIRNTWPVLVKSGALIIPDHAMNGLDLLWYSDLAISGGGTMNREAAALGVPVYSIFCGKIGAVDRYLVRTGRLVLLESPEDIPRKVNLIRRKRPAMPAPGDRRTLGAIVENIVSIVESEYSKQLPAIS